MTTTIALVALAVAVAFLWIWVAWIAHNLPRVFESFGTAQDNNIERITNLEADVEKLAQQVQELRKLADPIDAIDRDSLDDDGTGE